MHRIALPFAAACLAIAVAPTFAQHQHHHGAEAEEVKRPRIFLDKSPRIVEYQLKRLSNDQLLLVERKTDDPKYIPVYAAIASREGMPVGERQTAIDALATLKDSTVTAEILDTLGRVDDDDRTIQQLIRMLAKQKEPQLAEAKTLLQEAASASDGNTQIAAMAGLIAQGAIPEAIAAANDDDAARSVARAVSIIRPQEEIDAELEEQLLTWTESGQAVPLRRAAILATAALPREDTRIFEHIGSMIDDEGVQNAVVTALLSLAEDKEAPQTAQQIVNRLVAMAESTPASERTTNTFLDAMELAEKLMGQLPADDARAYRKRIRAVAVRVVRIHTVEEEMRYDTPYFAVEAGRPVEVWLLNEDLMPHNLVITAPESLKEVAMMAGGMQPTDMPVGLQYVPDTELVLHASKMVPSEGEDRLTFTAPTEPGEYPYVCTFPQHWMRMNGVMVVVEDLDAWLQNPTVPDNPVGSNRTFVQNWTVDDLATDIDQRLRGRSPEIGKRLFAEATCALCHKVAGEGGAVGPDLTDIFSRNKGDATAVLTEILDPSKKIDPKYAASNILTVDGQIITGLITKEDDEAVTLVNNPEAPEPTVVPQEDIEQIVRSPVSLMPKGLLDQYSEDEIFEILGYLQSVDPQPQP